MTIFRNYLIRCLMAGQLGLAACHTPAASVPYLVYIDSGRVMQQYHGTLAKRQVITQLVHKGESSLDSLRTSLTAGRLPVETQQTQLARRRAALGQQLQKASQLADQELLKEVNHYLQQHGKRHHYDFILGANDSGNIVYAAPARDITAEVIQGLNQQYDQQHPR